MHYMHYHHDHNVTLFKCTKSMPTVFGNALTSPLSAITAGNP